MALTFIAPLFTEFSMVLSFCSFFTPPAIPPTFSASFVPVALIATSVVQSYIYPPDSTAEIPPTYPPATETFILPVTTKLCISPET